MNKIIFFEGLHGSGKSTLAKEKAAELRRIYPKVQIVMRCEKPCPIDICRLAVLSEEEFRMFIHMIRPLCSEDAHTIEYQLMRFSSLEGEHYYVNWFEFLSQYHLWDKKVISYALNHELCDGKAGYEQYVEITRNRWKAFAKAISGNTVYLFEGALLQHPIIELLGYYELDDNSLEKVKDLIEYWAIRQNVGSEVRWAIENRANHEVIGIVALYYNKQHQTGEIRFGIGKEYWGKGLMREVLYELFQYCFTILRLKEITAACDLRNKRAISVIKKCGMTYKKTVQEECSGRYYFNIYKKTNSQG